MILRGRKPLLIAFAAELAAVMAVLVSVRAHYHWTGTDFSLWIKVVIASAAAAITAYLLRATLAWTAFLSALPALFVAALAVNLPLWAPAIGLAILVLVLRNSIGDRVPLYLSNAETLSTIQSLIAASDRSVQAIDLGCGFAAIPIALAKSNTHPDSRFVGIENAPLPYAVARFLAWRSGDSRVSVLWGSIWDVDLGPYDLVYAFLSPHPMAALYEKAHSEMRMNALLVSNSFPVPGMEPDRIIPIESGRATGLLLWHMPGAEKAPVSALR